MSTQVTPQAHSTIRLLLVLVSLIGGSYFIYRYVDRASERECPAALKTCETKLEGADLSCTTKMEAIGSANAVTLSDRDLQIKKTNEAHADELANAKAEIERTKLSYEKAVADLRAMSDKAALDAKAVFDIAKATADEARLREVTAVREGCNARVEAELQKEQNRLYTCVYQKEPMKVPTVVVQEPKAPAKTK